MPPRWKRAEPLYANIPAVDANVDWALGPGRAHFFRRGRQDRWMPVLVRLAGTTVRDFAEGKGFIEDARSLGLWQESVRVDSLYFGRDDDSAEIGFFTAMVRQGFFEFLRRNSDLRKFVVGVTLGLPLKAESLPNKGAVPAEGTKSP